MLDPSGVVGHGLIELAATAGDAVTADLAATLSAVADLKPDIAAVWQRLAREHAVHILAPSGPERRGQVFVNAARLYGVGCGAALAAAAAGWL